MHIVFLLSPSAFHLNTLSKHWSLQTPVYIVWPRLHDEWINKSRFLDKTKIPSHNGTKSSYFVYPYWKSNFPCQFAPHFLLHFWHLLNSFQVLQCICFCWCKDHISGRTIIERTWGVFFFFFWIVTFDCVRQVLAWGLWRWSMRRLQLSLKTPASTQWLRINGTLWEHLDMRTSAADVC